MYIFYSDNPVRDFERYDAVYEDAWQAYLAEQKEQKEQEEPDREDDDEHEQ